MAGRIRIVRNNAGIRALLRSPEMVRAVEDEARVIASKIRAGASQTPYGALDVSVQSTPNGGATGDRAQAFVVVAPPAALKWPDKERFDLVKRVAGEVTR